MIVYMIKVEADLQPGVYSSPSKAKKKAKDRGWTTYGADIVATAIDGRTACYPVCYWNSPKRCWIKHKSFDTGAKRWLKGKS